MNRDPRVSPWAARYIGPEEDDGQSEPVNVTPRKGKRTNPSVEAYLAEHPGAFTHRETIEHEKKPLPLWVRLTATAILIAWVGTFLVTLIGDLAKR